ncbi:hypothetical protein TNCV_631161, partial [Trichonephila clavipes]
PQWLSRVVRHGNSTKASSILSQAPNTEIPPLHRTRPVCRLELQSFKIPKAAGTKDHISASSPGLCPWRSGLETNHCLSSLPHRRVNSGY